jgi:hypothetical protein
MEHKTILQRLLTWSSPVFFALWLFLSIIVPILEYRFGKSGLTSLLSQFSATAFFGVFALLAVAAVLRWSGALPRTDETNVKFDGFMRRPSWRFRLFSLVFWILIALALVAFFNFEAQLAPDKRFSGMLVRVLPTLLIVFSLVAVVVGLRWDRGRKEEKKRHDFPLPPSS